MIVDKEWMMKLINEAIKHSTSKKFNFIDRLLLKLKKRYCTPISYYDKLWCIDFLTYICNNNPNLDLSWFEEEDIKEILKFIKNKIYIAFNSVCVENYYLYEKEDKRYYLSYVSDFKKNVKYTRQYTLITYKGKLFRLRGNLSFSTYISVFYHELGIRYIPTKILNDLSNKDMIDGGAYIGDSLIVLDSLRPKRIFAFEPEKKNFINLQETIKINRFNSKIIPLQKGLYDKEVMASIEGKGAKAKIDNKANNNDIYLTTIDSISKKYNANIGLIKLDVEGYELETIKGAKNTIIRNKPVLLISVYHAGKDFFEIPPLLKKWVPEYKYRFLNLNRISPFSERILLAYRG